MGVLLGAGAAHVACLLVPGVPPPAVGAQVLGDRPAVPLLPAVEHVRGTACVTA